MDPITHGIAGALLGKGFFSKRQTKVAIFAATLGAVAPDVDVFAELFSRDPLSIIRYHRAITHSFVALPVFAALLAALTPLTLALLRRWFATFRDAESPSFGMLTLIYGVGIASHIILDGMTSFGTRMWYPISSERVAWDMLFIVDLTFTTIILVPQVTAWIYRDRDKSRARAWRMWVIFTVSALLFWALARGAGYPFRLWIGGVASLVMGVLFFAPAMGGWGFRVTRAEWCRVGTYAMVAYLVACGFAHHAAILRAKAFADQNHIEIKRIGGLPIPPTLLEWGGAIRSPNGLYEAEFDLRDSTPPVFRFTPDSPPDPFIARAFELPEVHLYWQFARFPSILSFAEGEDHVVELGENRFSGGRRRSPQPFTYELVFDSNGDLIAQGWLTNGVLQQHLERITPRRMSPPARTGSGP